MMVNGKQANYKVMEYTNGLMEENILVNGRKIACMEKELIAGKMGDNILDNIILIKNRVMVFING